MRSQSRSKASEAASWSPHHLVNTVQPLSLFRVKGFGFKPCCCDLD